MSDEINQGETRETQSGETASYANTLENSGTYENSGTVQLEESTAFDTSSSIQSSGWSVSITHPTSGRVIRPSVINPQEVQYIPGPNTMPRIRLPVRVNVGWLDEEFNNNPSISVHLDGEELPVDELVDVEHEEGQTILIGEGGAELRQRVSEEYDAQERPVAVTDLVDANTSYNSVDNTPAPASDSSVVQSPSGETELNNTLDSTTGPVQATSGGLKPHQTCWTVEAENADSKDAPDHDDSEFSDGTGIIFVSTNSDAFAEWKFTPDYDIPSGELRIGYRNYAEDTPPRLEWSVNGTVVEETDNPTQLDWNTVNADEIGTLSAGSEVTVRVDQIEDNSGNRQIDVVAPFDNRFSYTFDNDNGGSGGYLDGPELYPPSTDLVFDVYESAFSIVGGSVSASLTDTSNNQALELSNDRGASYDITGSNTSSVSGDFPDIGATLNLKAVLSRYGSRSTATPQTGYQSQRIDDYELTADTEFESLLVDESYDNSLSSVLSEITGSQFAWKYSVESGTGTVTVDEPGNTTASSDPELSESRIRKQIQTHATVVIKGSTIPVSGEEFNGSTSFVNLAEDNILTGSEAVYDSSGTNFTRQIDYEMDYSGGQIKIISNGDMSSGTTYNIDYRHQVEASHTASEGSSDELIRTIPGVVSDRQAEQIAYVLAEVYPGVSTPRYEGRIVVPRLDVTFDPLEGLALEDLDLPDAATPLSIRGEPELSPLGLTLSLGSAPRLEESLRAISSQVSSLSDRV